jgi:phage-related protein
MPRTEVVFYRDDDGSSPVLEWLEALPLKARLKCLVRIERLRELGHDLRRPEADFLRDGIYELRVSLNRVQYRLLYAFHTWEQVGSADGSQAVKRGLAPKPLPPQGRGKGSVTRRTVAVLAHGLVK